MRVSGSGHTLGNSCFNFSWVPCSLCHDVFASHLVWQCLWRSLLLLKNNESECCSYWLSTCAVAKLFDSCCWMLVNGIVSRRDHNKLPHGSWKLRCYNYVSVERVHRQSWLFPAENATMKKLLQRPHLYHIRKYRFDEPIVRVVFRTVFCSEVFLTNRFVRVFLKLSCFTWSDLLTYSRHSCLETVIQMLL